MVPGERFRTDNTATSIAHLDGFALPDLAPDLGPGPDADGPQYGQDAVDDAAFPDSLRVSSGCQARHEVGDHTQATIIEAAEQTLLPLSHGGRSTHSLLDGMDCAKVEVDGVSAGRRSALGVLLPV